MKIISGWLIGLVFGVSAWAEPLLEGRVRLASGEPVADAQVRLFDLTDLRQGAVARAQTDGTGYFALPLAALGGRALPERFALGPNYPNPFNPSTIIPYQLAASAQVRLEVFNLLGQHIATLVDGERSAGFHTVTWTATDGAGRAVGAGVYIYRMTVGAESQTGRMVLLDGQAGVSAGGTAFVMPSASGVGESAEGVYGLIVSGSGLTPYVDSAFRVEAGMSPVELVVSEGPHSAGKATDDDCALCDLFGSFNDQQEEEEDEATEDEEETDSTSSEGGPDLIVQSTSVSAVMLTPGQAFTLDVTVHNQGDEQAAATMLHYYRSNNATITSSDTEVGTDAIDVLDASATSAQSIALTAPTGGALGVYYGACVASVRGESNTDNNCSSAVRITVSGQETPEDEEEEMLGDEEEEMLGDEGSDTPVTIPDANLRSAIAAVLGKARGATITKGEMQTLTHLRAFDAGISDLTGLEFATNLTFLSLRFNNISDVSALRGLTNLDFLSLDGNQITDISSLRGLTYLTWLQLADNNISDISSLRGLTYLTELQLGFNNISDISSLRGLTYLTELQLGFNNISDVSALRGLTYLQELYLEFNNISDVSSLRGLTNLKKLELRVNPLNSSSINDHIPALKRSGRAILLVLFDSFRESDFDIELVFLDDHFTEKHKRVIRAAARRWMSIIREDLPDYTFTQGLSGACGDHSYEIPSGERIDDLRIYIVGFDGYDGAPWGWAAPNVLRETSRLSVVGCMGFNMWIFTEPDPHFFLNHFLSTALHEIGHVLGVGTLWDDLGFLQNPSENNPNADTHFNGPLAIAAFNKAGGRNYTGAKVPVVRQEEGWPGSADSHWRGSVLAGELMSAGAGSYGYYVNAGKRLSAITIQSLADLGYVVDVTQADRYTLRDASAKASAKITAPSTHAQPEFSCGTGQQQEPIYVVDPQGRIVRTISP